MQGVLLPTRAQTTLSTAALAAAAYSASSQMGEGEVDSGSRFVEVAGGGRTGREAGGETVDGVS